MFTVTDNPTFTHPVKVSVPVDGGHERQDFRATFRMISAEEQDSFDLTTPEGTTGFLHAIIVELHDLVDDQGQPLPYSDRLRDRLLSFQIVRVALTQSYFGALKKAVEGN